MLRSIRPRRSPAPTRVRTAFRSGLFVEGWAVYAEALMVEEGYDAGLGERAAGLRQRFVDDVCDVIPILAYDQNVASEHAELLVAVRRAGRPRGAHDLIIAATARASKRSVVSGDLSAFTDLPGVTIRDRR